MGVSCLLHHLYFHKVDSSAGPYGTDITFSINDSNIASVDESGLITAKVSSDAIVTGESRGLDSVIGDIVTFSEVSFVILHRVYMYHLILYCIYITGCGICSCNKVDQSKNISTTVPSTKILYSRNRS